MMFISKAIHLVCYIIKGVCCVATGALTLIWLNRILKLCPGPLETLLQCDVKDDETRQAEYVVHVWRDTGQRTSSPFINIEASLTHQEEFRSSHGALVLLRQPCSGILRSPRMLCSEFESLFLFFFFYNSPSKHAGVNLEMYSFANYLLEMSRVTSFCWGGKLITLSAYKKHWAAACTRWSELFLSDIIWKHCWLSM